MVVKWGPQRRQWSAGFNEGAQFFNWGGSSHLVRQDGALQSLVHLLAGWQSDEELKRLMWLACGALVVKSNILEIIREAMLVQTGPEWEPRVAQLRIDINKHAFNYTEALTVPRT